MTSTKRNARDTGNDCAIIEATAEQQTITMAKLRKVSDQPVSSTEVVNLWILCSNLYCAECKGLVVENENHELLMPHAKKETVRSYTTRAIKHGLLERTQTQAGKVLKLSITGQKWVQSVIDAFRERFMPLF